MTAASERKREIDGSEHGGAATLLLIHGGLWEDMDAERFWQAPGIVGGLRQLGFRVVATERARRAPGWDAELDHLAPALPAPPDGPATVVAGSNGCSAAVRLALAFPDRVARLLLAWPATAGDPTVDARTRARLREQGASPETATALLAGETLRGVADSDLGTLAIPVGVLPAAPENLAHQRRTVDALLRAVPRADELPGSPEPPRPDFPPHRGSFVETVAAFARP